jgi:hypothetical protein
MFFLRGSGVVEGIEPHVPRKIYGLRAGTLQEHRYVDEPSNLRQELDTAVIRCRTRSTKKGSSNRAR